MAMFGKPEPGSKYFELHQKLQLNTSRFAAYKANKVTGLIKNLPAAKFDENATKVLKNFNRYQSAEYNAVVARSRTAKQFTDFEREAHLYPMLEWLPTSSVTPRDEHVRLVGTILPINDPFWNENQPGNLWGCKCDWKTTDAPASDILPKTVTPSPGLDGNPATEGDIFTDQHPYIAKSKTNDDVEDFALKNVLKTAIKESKDAIPQFIGNTISSDNLVNNEIVVLKRTIDDIMEHNKNFKVRTYALNIDEAKVNKWEYIGWKEVENYPKGHPKAGKCKHPEAEYFLYYSTEIGGKKRYVNVKMHRNYKKEVLYCIVNTIEKGIIEGKP